MPRPKGPLTRPIQLKINMTKEVHAVLIAAAKKGNRSLTMEINLRLEATIDCELVTTFTMKPIGLHHE